MWSELPSSSQRHSSPTYSPSLYSPQYHSLRSTTAIKSVPSSGLSPNHLSIISGLRYFLLLWREDRFRLSCSFWVYGVGCRIERMGSERIGMMEGGVIPGAGSDFWDRGFCLGEGESLHHDPMWRRRLHSGWCVSGWFSVIMDWCYPWGWAFWLVVFLKGLDEDFKCSKDYGRCKF